jgi:hypothetical protein
VSDEWIDHPAFSEANPSGPVTQAAWESIYDLPPPKQGRFLINYSLVTRIDVTVSQLISVAEAMDALGWKVAVVAPSDVIFGTVNRAVLLSRVAGDRMSVFKDRESGVNWLLGQPPGRRD